MKKYLGLLIRASFLFVYVLSFVFPSQSASASPGDISIYPNSWNVIGLDSNSPADGPFRFPIGAKVCNNTASPISDVVANFVWDDSKDTFWNDPNVDDYINLRDDSLDSITIPTIAKNDCEDVFFEVEVLQDSSAFDKTRSYYIEAVNGADPAITTSRPRELYVEYLISQNRNSVTDVLLGSTSVPPGGTMYLMEGQTYFITLKGGTATQGYNQFEDFINFPNTIFQILSVETTYSADSNVPPLSSPYPYLYADSCGWDNDPNSPTYRSCIESDEKSGGSNVETIYEIKILSNTAGQSGTLNTLLYDFSGSSYHYNADFSFGTRTFEILGPESVDITKTFSPKAISSGGTSVLTFKITNPTPATITGANFIDDFTDPPMPAGLTVYTTPDVSTPGCDAGTLTKVGGGALTGGETAVSFSGGTILPNSTCTINVTVTSADENTYPNTTRHLFIDIDGTNTDTGNFDDDTLKVADSVTACTPGQTLVTWTVPVGSTNPPDSATGNPTVNNTGSTATASAQTIARTSIDTISPVGGDGSSWLMYGLQTGNYVQFVVDTSNYTGVQMAFQMKNASVANGPTAATVSYNDGSGFQTYTGALTLPAVTDWTPKTIDFTNKTSTTGNTTFRIAASGANNDNTGAGLNFDAITFTGCKNAAPPPTITKSFGTDPIKVGDTSKLTITVTNASSTQSLTDVGFTDSLPAGIEIKEPVNLTDTTCTLANVTTNTSTDTITLDNQTLQTLSANRICSIVVDVVGTASGQLNNVTGYVSVSNVDTNNYAEDPITVWAPPVIGKSFSLSPVDVNAVTKLTFTITNPNIFDTLNGVGFSDNLSLINFKVASSPAATQSTSCGGTWTPLADDTSLSFTGGSIPAGQTCTLSVNVVGTIAGTYTNNTTNVTSTEGGNGNIASANVVVEALNASISLTKQISKAGATGPWSNFVSVLPNSNIWYRFVVYNSGDVTLSDINVTDPPAGGAVTCSWTDESNNPLSDPWTLAPGATAYCVIADTADAIPDSYPNTAQAHGTYLAADDVDSNQSTAVYAIPELVLDKSADRALFSAAGETINYTFVVTNKDNGYDASIQGPVTITDPLIAGASCPALTAGGAGDNDDDDNFLEPGESITCTGSYVTLLTPDVDTNKEVVNTAAASAGGITSNQDSVTVELAQPAMTLTKDNGTTTVTAGGTTTYTLTVTNDGNAPTSGTVTVVEAPPTGVTVTAISGTGWTCVLGTLTCTRSDALAASSSYPIITVSADISASATGPLVNKAQVGGGGDPTNPNPPTNTTAGQCTGSGTPNEGCAIDSNEVFASSPSKSIVNTSEPSTTFVSGTERVAIGEIIRYRLATLIPQGSFTNVQLVDNLPDGLQFLDDGTAKVAFVSNGGGITSSTLICTNDTGNAIDLASLPSANVDCNLAGAISGGPFVSGTNATVSVGNITNSDADTDLEYIVIEFNALVLNVNADTTINQGINNQTGANVTNNRQNDVTLYVNGSTVGSTSSNVTVAIAEPAITSLTKSISPATGPYLPGGSVIYTLTFSNNAAGNNATTAFDIALTDTFNSDLTLGTVSISSMQGVSGVATCAGGTSFTASSTTVAQLLTVNVSCLDPGNSVTVTVDATVGTSTDISNSASLTYTSLPGAQGNCATAPFSCSDLGATGSGTGERNGSDGTGADGTVLNNYAVTSNTVGGTSITIIKDASPDSAQDFAFTGSGPSGFDFAGGFSLDDDANNTLSNRRVFNNLTPGSYSVLEGTTSGWSLNTLSCVDPDSGSTTDLGTATATIDLDAGENIICTYTNTQSAADLSIDKTLDTAGPYTVGQSVTYTLTVTNGGPSTASNVSVSDTPTNLTITNVTSPTMTCTGSAFPCTLPSLANSGTATITVTASIDAVGAFDNEATVTSATNDPDPNNNTDDTGNGGTATSIDAVNDSGSTIDGTAGGQSLANVLTNDSLNGTSPVDINDVNLTQVSTTNAGVTLNTADGSVNVAAGTPAGSYTVTYQICDKLNPTVCDTATVTVPVVSINAVNDSGSTIDGTAGGQSLANVLTNDSLNGTSPVDINDVNLTQVLTTNAGVTLNPADGSVNVAAGTPTGSYTITYQICDKLNPTVCDTATVSVPVNVDADVTLTKALTTVGPFTVGQSISYTVTVTNNGPSTATNVSVSDTLTNLTITNVTSPTMTCTGNAFPCTLASLGNASNATITVTATINSTGAFDNSATVTSATPDSNPNNNTDNDGDTAGAPDLVVDKVDALFTDVNNNGLVEAGDTIQYTVTITNNGAGDANNVAFADTPDVNTTLAVGSVTTTQGTVTTGNTAGDTTVAVNVGTLTSGSGSVTITFNVTVNSGLPAVVTSVSNQGAVGGSNIPNTPTNDPGTPTADDPTVTNISLATIFDPPAAFKTFNAAGLPVLEFRMVWINNGNAAAINVQVTDTIPDGTTYVANSITCTPTNAVPAVPPSSTAGVASAPLSGTAVPVSSCGYDAVANRIQWQGTIAPDPGVANDANAEANANHEIIITFQVTVDANVNQVSNVGTSRTDANNNGAFTDQADVLGTTIANSNLAVWDRNTGGGGSEREPREKLPVTLPDTGFAPNKMTLLPEQPKDLAYRSTDIWLEVPRLGLKMPIVGVPLAEDDWNLSWLWDEAGWLEGTAFPSWQGNSVLTGHITLPNGEAGPFASLGKLNWGDRILIHAYGEVYTYEVRQNRTVSPTNTSVLQHEEESWVTLLTCKTYNESTGTYSNRTAVRAVLIRTAEEKITGGSNIR